MMSGRSARAMSARRLDERRRRRPADQAFAPLRRAPPPAAAPSAYSSFWFCTSFGTSSSTGPGRPSRATANASRTASASSSTSSTRRLCLVIGWVMPMMSVSWKASRPDHGARHLAGDRDHRRVVHVRRGEAGHQVGGARPRGGDAHARPPARAGVAVGGVGRGLLVPHQHVAEPGILRQRVVERHDRAAGIAEEQVHALLEQGPAEDLGAGELLRHHTPHR